MPAGQEDSGRSLSLEPTVAHVRLSPPVDHHGATADPDALAVVRLCIDGEHTGRSDHQMVDVAAACPDRNGVQGPEVISEFAEPLGHQLFTRRALTSARPVVTGQNCRSRLRGF